VSRPIEELDRAEIDELLHASVVGRIGCHAGGRTYVVPVIYAYDGGSVYVASVEGRKIRMMREQPAVCFEVDEYHGPGGWRSVIAEGTYVELDADEAQQALALLGARFAGSGREPRRPSPGGATVVCFRIDLDEPTGRAVRLGGNHTGSPQAPLLGPLRGQAAPRPVRIRPAGPDDVDFLVGLASSGDVEPFLSRRTASDRESVLAELERAGEDPVAFGRYVIEVDGERAGSLGWERLNERNRIVRAERLALDPRFRGRGIADDAARQLQRLLLRDLGYHRIELQVYGFNERALRHADRVGYVREGVLRKAYRRHGEWQDAVLFSLLADELPDE
jgi:nitroimidazol reductase NimA-like FMN-containing flavoprotein (pyridoxamine 5'-phosphate oxidase superfamily)/RimJ/RimL family protein N-acetyltransferase